MSLLFSLCTETLALGGCAALSTLPGSMASGMPGGDLCKLANMTADPHAEETANPLG